MNSVFANPKGQSNVVGSLGQGVRRKVASPLGYFLPIRCRSVDVSLPLRPLTTIFGEDRSATSGYGGRNGEKFNFDGAATAAVTTTAES